jgi:hypothetical protein
MAGLAALPLFAFDPRPGAPKVFVVALACLIPLAMYWWQNGGLLVYGGLFPSVDGVLTIYGAYSPAQYAGQRPVVLGEPTRLVLTLLGCVGGAMLFARLGNRVAALRWHLAKPMNGESGWAWLVTNPLLLFTIFQLPFIVAPFWIFDRYFVVLLPAALSLAAPLGPLPRRAWLPGLAALGVVAVISLALMHDWLAWNRARWDLGDRAIACGIPMEELEGGLEWNGWHAAQAGRSPRGDGAYGLAVIFTQLYFPHISATHALAFSELPDTKVIDAEPYSQWLVPGDWEFLLIKQRGIP